MKKLRYILLFSLVTFFVNAQNKKGNAGAGGNTKPNSEKEFGVEKEMPNFLSERQLLPDKVEFYELTEALIHPETVTSLKLNRQGLTEIPKDLNKFINLVELDLSQNNIGDFSSKLTGLNKLTVLNLSGNNLTTIPSDICQLKSLKILNLGSNKISSGSVSCLQGLERLFLNSNELSSLPGGVTEIQSLKSLYLYSNKLTTLDEKLARMPNLEVLLVQYNKIAEEPNVFRQNSIVNYTFNPQHINSKQLYKYNQSESSYKMMTAENSMGTQQGLVAFTSLDDQSNKGSGPWKNIGKYFGGRIGQVFGGSDGQSDFEDRLYFQAELGFNKSAVGIYYTDYYERIGFYFSKYFKDLSSKFRPYVKAGIDYEIDSDPVSIGLQAKVGADYFPVKFFGLNAEAGYSKDGYANIGIILRLNARKKS